MLLTVSRIAVGDNVECNSGTLRLPGNFPMLGHQNSPEKATAQYRIRL